MKVIVQLPDHKTEVLRCTVLKYGMDDFFVWEMVLIVFEKFIEIDSGERLHILREALKTK